MDWIPAAFGLLGVIVGGLITAVSSYYLDLRRERTTNERDSRNYAIEIKRAARLIELELRVAQADVEAVIEQKTWLPKFQPKTEEWQKHSSVIATALSSYDWAILTEAIVAIEGIGLVDLVDGETSPSVHRVFHLASESIDQGINAIKPLVSDVAPTPPKVSLRRRMVLYFLYNE